MTQDPLFSEVLHWYQSMATLFWTRKKACAKQMDAGNTHSTARALQLHKTVRRHTQSSTPRDTGANAQGGDQGKDRHWQRADYGNEALLALLATRKNTPLLEWQQGERSPIQGGRFWTLHPKFQGKWVNHLTFHLMMFYLSKKVIIKTYFSPKLQGKRDPSFLLLKFVMFSRGVSPKVKFF